MALVAIDKVPVWVPVVLPAAGTVLAFAGGYAAGVLEHSPYPLANALAPAGTIGGFGYVVGAWLYMASEGARWAWRTAQLNATLPRGEAVEEAEPVALVPPTPDELQPIKRDRLGRIVGGLMPTFANDQQVHINGTGGGVSMFNMVVRASQLDQLKRLVDQHAATGDLVPLTYDDLARVEDPDRPGKKLFSQGELKNFQTHLVEQGMAIRIQKRNMVCLTERGKRAVREKWTRYRSPTLVKSGQK